MQRRAPNCVFYFLMELILTVMFEHCFHREFEVVLFVKFPAIHQFVIWIWLWRWWCFRYWCSFSWLITTEWGRNGRGSRFWRLRILEHWHTCRKSVASGTTRCNARLIEAWSKSQIWMKFMQCVSLRSRKTAPPVPRHLGRNGLQHVRFVCGWCSAKRSNPCQWSLLLRHEYQIEILAKDEKMMQF